MQCKHRRFSQGLSTSVEAARRDTPVTITTTNIKSLTNTSNTNSKIPQNAFYNPQGYSNTIVNLQHALCMLPTWPTKTPGNARMPMITRPPGNPSPR